jgi:hypothetical protein
MIEKIHELKQKAMDRADYYSRINFPNLANEFTELVNILNEMEAIVTERDELKARVQIMTEEARAAREDEMEEI